MNTKEVEFMIEHNSQNESATLYVDGFVDAETAADFDKQLTSLRIKQIKLLILDFSKLIHFSSQGITFLVQNTIAFKKNGGEIKIVGLNDNVKAIFDELCLSKFFL